MNDSFYKIELDIDDDTLVMINDLMRMFIMQVVVQCLFYLRHDSTELLSDIFLENLLFILLGLFVYWFVVNRFVKFDNKDPNKHNNHHQSRHLFK